MRFEAALARGLGCRDMTDADLPFAAELYASTRAEEVAATGWPETVQREFLAAQHTAQHEHYRRHYAGADWWIVERGGAPVGRLYLWRGKADWRVVDISLAPAARGQGLGTALLADVIAQAGEAGCSVSIHVEKNNPARRLYQRLGFAVAEDKGIYDLMLRPAGPPA